MKRFEMEKGNRSSVPTRTLLWLQPDITVLTGAVALRILFDHRRACSIEFRYRGKTVRAQATHEVILSLGAIHTPKLLIQSGTGDETELKRADIPVLHALPGLSKRTKSY